MSMGIYLPDMEMPRKGQMLVTFPDGTSYVCFNGMRERLTQTTAFPVLPHGDLIDRDALVIDNGLKEIPEFYEVVRDAPTVIPAEG
jgi:hypothetical protein